MDANTHRHVRTERLRLDAVTASDLDEMFALHSDPDVWRHYPSARHTEPARTEAMIAKMERAWTAAGLGHWCARTVPAGAFVGVGGCAMRHDAVWNAYYRLVPAAHGHGYASELVAAGRKAADEVAPNLPVVAYLVEHNVASKAVAERAGLDLVWRGPDFGNPDPEAIRLVYADRPIDPDVMTKIVGQP